MTDWTPRNICKITFQVGGAGRIYDKTAHVLFIYVWLQVTCNHRQVRGYPGLWWKSFPGLGTACATPDFIAQQTPENIEHWVSRGL